MYKLIIRAAMAAALATTTVAHAAPEEVIQPVQVDNETVRYDRGAFLVEAIGRDGAVQIRSMPSDHGNLSFQVAILNTSAQPINVDVANIRIEGTAEPVRVLSKSEMVHKAENRASWARALTAVGGGLAANGWANQRQSYLATTFTPWGGVYHTQIDAPCGTCQAAAAATLAATRYKIAKIQSALDRMRDSLGEQALQLTTVYPGQGMAGRFFLTRFKRSPMSGMRLIVSLNGEDHVFGFRFVKAGSPTPPFRMAPAFTQAVSSYAPAVTTANTQSVATPAMALRPTPAVLLVSAGRPAVGVSAGVKERWQRYYGALLANGMARAEAKRMTDRQFGAID